MFSIFLRCVTSTGRPCAVNCPSITVAYVQGLVPLLGVDMWEHAYYLQYNNVKADYLKEIWKIVNWKDVATRYSKAQ